MQKEVRFRPKGLKAGMPQDLNIKKIYYFNGCEMVLIFKNKNGDIKICRVAVLPTQAKTLLLSDFQSLTIEQNDIIQIFQVVKVYKNNVGNVQIQKAVKWYNKGKQLTMGLRLEGVNRFYFTFSSNKKSWEGRWGMPKKNKQIEVDVETGIIAPFFISKFDLFNEEIFEQFEQKKIAQYEIKSQAYKNLLDLKLPKSVQVQNQENSKEQEDQWIQK